MIRIDTELIFSLIEKNGFRSVGLSAPDGILYKLPEVAREIENRYPGVSVFVFLEATYGTCDLQNAEADRLNLDAVFNIGHSTDIPKMGTKTFLIGAEYDVDVEAAMATAAEVLRSHGHTKVGLITTSNYRGAIARAEAILTAAGFEVVKSKPFPSLFEGQVFGCNYYAPRNSNAEAFLFIGQSMFHAAGIYLSTQKPTYLVDPHFGEVTDVKEEGDKMYKKAVLGIYKAKGGDKFGIIVGLREGQSFRAKGEWFKTRLSQLGKVATLMALRDISPARINLIRDYDAFIELGCPRIPMADRGFEKPLLSYPQGLALVRLLEGKDIGDIFNMNVWA